jgi:predicted component of type VI protein secretion system
MLSHHTPEQDLPSHTDRERDRRRLDAALNDFLAKGGQVVEIKPTEHAAGGPSFVISAQREELGQLAEAKPATEVSDEDLVRLLRARALLGDTLRTASRRLQQPLDRCHALARTHRLPFKVGYVKGGSRT